MMASKSITQSKSPAASDRHARRRERTRAILIVAARTVFARKGIENTAINEITDEADVGFGTFYNHFESKEAIVEAVVAEALVSQRDALASVTETLEDPAEVVSVAHRHWIGRATTDPDWAWLLVRVSLSHTIALAQLGPFGARDIERGIKARRFTVANKRVALLGTGGALLAVMRDVLDGTAPRDAARLHAEGVLRMLGLAPDDAAEVARRPMPAIPTGQA